MTNINKLKGDNMEIVNEYNRVTEQRIFTKNEIYTNYRCVENEQVVETHKAIVNDEGSPIPLRVVLIFEVVKCFIE